MRKSMLVAVAAFLIYPAFSSCATDVTGGASARAPQIHTVSLRTDDTVCEWISTDSADCALGGCTREAGRHGSYEQGRAAVRPTPSSSASTRPGAGKPWLPSTGRRSGVTEVTHGERHRGCRAGGLVPEGIGDRGVDVEWITITPDGVESMAR